ncbi:O-antigen ligase family protein [Pseudomonas shirazensis]
MKHLKKFKLYYLLAIIFFLASFRGDPGAGEALTYKVPFYISFVQKVSIYIVILIMTLSLLFDKNKFKYQSYYKQAIFFFIFFLILILSGSNYEEAFYRLIFSIITFLYFVKIVSRLDLQYVLLFVCYAAFAFSLVNFLCYFLLPSTIWNGRLFGVTSHPNFTGVAACVSSIFSFYFLINAKWKLKVLYLFMFSTGIAVCIFSGSRNSIISFVFSFLVYLFIKTKGIAPRVMLVLVSFLFILLLLNIDFSMSSLDYEGRGNTREGTWKSMSEAALELPIFGIGKSGASSNSYLFAIVASGLVGFLFLISSIIGYIKRLASSKMANNKYIPLFCMITAALFFAAIFEGFLLDQVGIPVFAYWLLLVVKTDNYNIKVKDEKRYFKMGY